MIKNYLKIAWRNLWRNRVFYPFEYSFVEASYKRKYALLTVSIQSVKAASMNPVKALRTE
ncbi:hypothetical protein [Chitinophaga ginsengisoli]|uniref:Uncharacterized protein n=1 Tax=Chitinophaga ginsengisoli TaxID=363837 RepID=A0A2P8GP60_9BACT|nr:hypothetical protein [Chitinophaga ginsengisoli]PSL35751.1 hypothetical protein CLV42_101513 [Chitinophaga ginsengisoli]